MLKHSIRLCSVLTVSVMCAREFRTPLPFESHFRDRLYRIREDKKNCIDTWFGAYSRTADDAYCAKKTQPLSCLLFGATNFTAAQAFAYNTATSPVSPLLNTTLTPRFKYTDQGGVLGLSATRRIHDAWHLGVRAQLPIRSFEIERLASPGSGSSILGGENVDDVIVRRTEDVAGATVDSYAYRLDFLSGLPLDCQEPGIRFPFVVYNNTDFMMGAVDPMTIANVDVTDNPALQVGTDDRNPVTVLQSTTQPSGVLAIPLTEAVALPALANDGMSLEQNERAKFALANDYTALGADTTTQKLLWIVPSVAGGQLVDKARVIDAGVKRLLMCIDDSAEAFFARCAQINFDCQKLRGVGDLDIDVFARYECCTRVDVEGFLGLRLPTGKKVKEPTNVFAVPLGNNGHTEVKFGTVVRWEPCDWFVFNVDALYALVAKRNEHVAASFFGACVKNINPTTCADVSWAYCQTHVNTTWYIAQSECYDVNALLGYELYRKRTDAVKFKTERFDDCLGVNQLLDRSVIEKNTEVTSHKLYGELSCAYRVADWSSVRLYGGYSGVVGGKNVPKERGWHLGAHWSVYFD